MQLRVPGSAKDFFETTRRDGSTSKFEVSRPSKIIENMTDNGRWNSRTHIGMTEVALRYLTLHWKKYHETIVQEAKSNQKTDVPNTITATSVASGASSGTKN